MIKIFTDSGSSIKPWESEALGVTVIPLSMYIGEREYRDGEELSTEEFYKMLIEDGLFPRTSLPSLAECEEKVRACTEKGDAVIFLTISSGLSGTYSAIKGLFDGDPLVHVVDTKTAVGGIRILVEEINKRLDEPVEEILKEVYELIPRIKVVAVPETLEYLHRGGRCSGLAALAGGALKLHPQIVVKDGKMDVAKKFRGNMKKVLLEYTKELTDALMHAKKNRVFITHSGCDKETVDAIHEYVSGLNVFEEILETTAGGVISSHCGPGTLGVLFIEE
jgi:DegV family protein with EDD domain